MNLHDRNYKTINVDDFLSPEDFDRKGIETCLRGFDKCTCNHCSLNLIVLDAFFDYFIENLKTRSKSLFKPENIPHDLIHAYQHVHNGQMAVHCIYNGWYRAVKLSAGIEVSK